MCRMKRPARDYPGGPPDGLSDQLLWLRHDSKIGSRCLPALRIHLLGLFVGDRTSDNHVLARLPIDRRRYLVLRRQLQRVDYPQNLVEIAPGRHRIDQDKLDLLIWTDHKNIADREIIGWRVCSDAWIRFVFSPRAEAVRSRAGSSQ